MHMKGRIRFVHTDTEKTKPWESGFRPHSSDDGNMEAGSWRWAGVHGCEEDSLKVKVLCGASAGRSAAPFPALGYPLLQHGSSDKGLGSYSLTRFSSTTPGSHLQWVLKCAHCRNTMVQPFCNALRASACNNECCSPSSSRLGGMWSASQMNAVRLSFPPEFCRLCTLLPSLPSAACFPKMSWSCKFNSSISSSALFIVF